MREALFEQPQDTCTLRALGSHPSSACHSPSWPSVAGIPSLSSLTELGVLEMAGWITTLTAS